MTILLLSLAGGARAGSYPLIVAADGEGVPVYTASGGRKQAGILYNGFTSELSLDGAHGRHSCRLTRDTTVWLNPEQAMKRLPGNIESPRDRGADQVPCSCFLAEVVPEYAKVYTGTGHKRLLLEHRRGTLVVVCGEFGQDYFIDGTGFVAKSALRKVRDLTFPETGRPDFGLTGLTEAAVYLESSQIRLASSAGGVSVDSFYGSIRNGSTVYILRDLDGWAQVARISDMEKGYGYGGFIESRYLDPAGDHTVPTAVVKTDHPLNRLNVRSMAEKDSRAENKLCSGVRVQIVSSFGGWTEIALYGEAGTWGITGFVQSAYLTRDPEEAADARVRVRFRLEKTTRYSQVPVSDGDEGTVVGVRTDVNTFIVHLDSGEIVAVREEGTKPVLEPIDPAVWEAKTTRSLTLRSGPSSSSEKLRTLKSGATVEVLLRGEKWALVRAGGEAGYVLSSGLKPVK